MISVIIPTLNESAFIIECIDEAISKSTSPIEIIVVDAGSNDDTLELVRKYSNIKVCHCPELKGLKYASLNKGGAMASGEILLFLDADTILPENFNVKILEALSQPQVVGGAFEMKFDKTTPALKIIQILNSVRYNLTKRCYGDQAVYCTSKVFKEIGGYPEKKVLEAAHFCAAMTKRGKVKILSAHVITSSRRFLEGGVWSTFLFDLYLLTMDFFGLNIDRSAEKYWSKNN